MTALPHAHAGPLDRLVHCVLQRRAAWLETWGTNVAGATPEGTVDGAGAIDALLRALGHRRDGAGEDPSNWAPAGSASLGARILALASLRRIAVDDLLDLRPALAAEELRALDRAFDAVQEELVAGGAAGRRRGDEAALLDDLQALNAGLLASALDAIIAMDDEGRILEFNAGAERTFGWTREQVLHRDLASVIIPPDLRGAHHDGLRRHLAGGPAPVLGKRLEVRSIRADGSEFPAELTVTRIEGRSRPTFMGTVRDLSERKRVERELRTAHDLLASLVDASPLPIITLDDAGHVQIWNRAAEQMFGWTREEAAGKEPPYLLEHEAKQALALHQAAAAGSVLTSLEVRRRRKDGKILDLSASFSQLRDPHGSPRGTLAIFQDITERKRVEEEAIQTARFREQFVGIVGHDLRSPLSAIIHSAQLLQRHGGLTDQQARVIGRIGHSGERMSRMINDLLDFTRSRLGGVIPIEPRRVNLAEICGQVVEELGLSYPSRPIELRVMGDAWGSWDPDRMAQVVSNLVGNALQHSPDGAPVEVVLRDTGAQVLLETSNGGPAIPSEVLPHIFEPGRQGAAEGARRSSNLGLGLFIVRQIVLAHGGTIEVQSSDALGTSFTVVLPRRARLHA